MKFILRLVDQFLWPDITQSSLCVIAASLPGRVDLTEVTV
jgi:hypothetical protein